MHFIQVAKVSCCHGEQGLATGDILLKLGDNPVTQMSDLRIMFTHKSLALSIIRNTKKTDIIVPTIPLSSWRGDKVVWFCGAQLESPYSPIPFCARKLYSQIFVTCTFFGSPAEMYNLPSQHFITRVNGEPTEDLDSFTQEIKKLDENKFCQITVASLQGVTKTVLLLPNLRDFGTVVARREGNEWHVPEL